MIKAAGMTDPGLMRPHNEDACGIFPASGCVTVADGVGGAAAGEVASHLFISHVEAHLDERNTYSEQESVAVIKKIYLAANTAILEHVMTHPECRGMSCTAEMLFIFAGGFVLGHVGDSRSYRFRNGKLIRLTKDHSLVQQQIDSGALTPEEAQKHRYRNVIIRAVGTDDALDVDIVRGRIRADDIFLLCTDGLTDMVAETEICSILERDTTLEKMAVDLISSANREGGRDNVTVALVRVS